MTHRMRFFRLLPIGVCAVALWSVPLHAQEVADPEAEALIAPTLQVEPGLALARRQIQENDLLGAVGALERVLLAQPDANAARLLYASLLCRLDDLAGARMEIALLQGREVDDTPWAEVVSACGSLPRPTAGAASAVATAARTSG